MSAIEREQSGREAGSPAARETYRPRHFSGLSALQAFRIVRLEQGNQLLATAPLHLGVAPSRKSSTKSAATLHQSTFSGIPDDETC